MKKKLLIVSHALELGGAERSLIGLLNAFDFEKYDVDLFLLRHEGELMREIPSAVNLIARNSRLYSISATDKADFKGRTFHIKYGKTCGENGSGKI